MPNTLTNLTPDAYKALDVVSRELVGFIPAVLRDPSTDMAALGQRIRIPITGRNTAVKDATPAMSLPAEASQTIGNQFVEITKVRSAPFSWNGEEVYAMNRGAGALNIQQDQIAQAFRALTNEMELDLYSAARVGASRAFGTAGTTPFGTNLGESAQMKKILDDNGAPGVERSLVVNTTAGASIRTLLNNPLNANTSLNGEMTRQGVILDVNGFAFRESAQISSITAGAMASATTSNAALTVGQTVLPLATAGTGQVAAGDVIALANDTNRYVVASVSFAGANPASGDSITIAAPGLLRAQAAATRAITVTATSSKNIGFTRNSIVLATRLPILEGQDQADFREVVTDPVSGLSFELAHYGGYRMGTWEVAIAWGVKVVKPEHMAILLGDS